MHGFPNRTSESIVIRSRSEPWAAGICALLEPLYTGVGLIDQRAKRAFSVQVTPWMVQRPNATGYLTLPQAPSRASGLSSNAMKALGGNGLSRERAFSAEKPKRG